MKVIKLSGYIGVAKIEKIDHDKFMLTLGVTMFEAF